MTSEQTDIQALVAQWAEAKTGLNGWTWDPRA